LSTECTSEKNENPLTFGENMDNNKVAQFF